MIGTYQQRPIYMYGTEEESTEAAMKAAGPELKAGVQLFKLPESLNLDLPLHVPTYVLIGGRSQIST